MFPGRSTPCQRVTRYEIKQKLWSFKDDFLLRGDSNTGAFRVSSKVWSWGHQLTFTDPRGNELALIKQKLASWGPTYEVEQGGGTVATVKKKLELPLVSTKETGGDRRYHVAALKSAKE